MCRRKAFVSGGAAHGLARSLIEQSQRGGPEMVAESTAGIIPGDRGKVGGNWCRLPLTAAQAGGRQISPVPLAGVVSGQAIHEEVN